MPIYGSNCAVAAALAKVVIAPLDIAWSLFQFMVVTCCYYGNMPNDFQIMISVIEAVAGVATFAAFLFAGITF